MLTWRRHHKQGAFRIVMVALTKGAALRQHEVASPVSIHVLRGCLAVTTEKGDRHMPPRGLIAFNAGVAHSVRALEDCATLITLAMPFVMPKGNQPARLEESSSEDP